MILLNNYKAVCSYIKLQIPIEIVKRYFFAAKAISNFILVKICSSLLWVFNDDIIEVAANYNPFFGRQVIFKAWHVRSCGLSFF